ncbi:hypothetical protein Q5O24_09060 [Eubacteriaceae bacterium ES3]|nr:hypothetical protein Q5O24_09060 [Eubacteriaceae bacterium ES3]
MNNYFEQAKKDAKVQFNRDLIAETIGNLEELRTYLLDSGFFGSRITGIGEADHMAAELMKVAELKRISAMLEGMNQC